MQYFDLFLYDITYRCTCTAYIYIMYIYIYIYYIYIYTYASVYTMTDHLILLSTKLYYHVVLLSTVMYYYLLWCTIIYYDVLLSTSIFHTILHFYNETEDVSRVSKRNLRRTWNYDHYNHAQNRTFAWILCFLAQNGVFFRRTPTKCAKGSCRKFCLRGVVNLYPSVVM